MSLSVIRQTKALPALLLFFYLSTNVIAAPFTPITQKHVPSLNEGLNFYPYTQVEIEEYTFEDADKHLNSGSDGKIDPTSRSTFSKQRELMGKIHGKFSDEFPQLFETLGKHRKDWDVDYDRSWNERDAFQNSYLEGIEWASEIPVSGSRAPRPRNSPNRFRGDHYTPHPLPVIYHEDDFHLGHLVKREIDHINPQAAFRQAQPNPPRKLPDIPQTPKEPEHPKSSWFILDNISPLNFPFGKEPKEDIPSWETHNHADKEISSSEFEARAPPLDVEFSVIFEIGNALNANEANEVDQVISGLFGPTSELMVDVPYTETLMEYREVQTVCITREVGPIFICERVYAETDGDDVDGDELTIESLQTGLEELKGNEIVSEDPVPIEEHSRKFMQRDHPEEARRPRLKEELRHLRYNEESRRPRFEEEPRRHGFKVEPPL